MSQVKLNVAKSAKISPCNVLNNRCNFPTAARRMPAAGKVPKKPGNIPPFALFVQDHRPGIMEENRDIRLIL